MSKTVIRTVFIVVFTALAVVFNGSDLMLPWHPYGWFGFVVEDGRTVRAVAPFAAAQGLRSGDQIDPRRLTAADRFSLERVAAPGRVLTFPLTGGQIVTVVARPRSRTTFDNITDIIDVVATLAYIIIAAVLVLLRPAPATWAFYAFSYGFCVFAATPNTWPFPLAVAGQTLFVVATSIAPAAFVSFALRFPERRPGALALSVERFLLFFLSPLLGALSLYDLLSYIFAAVVAPPWVRVIISGIVVAVFSIGIVVLIGRYVSADVADRNRLRWVVLALAVAYLPFLAWELLWSSGWVLLPLSPATINLFQSWCVFAPIAVAYTVLKHRLFDIRFVVSRALMYALMTSLVVGGIALVDWGFSRWLTASRFALLVELALALLLGVALTSLHRRIEQFLNAVIFRSQLLAMQALRRFALETDLISDPHRLISQTYAALRTRLECDYAAVYTADGASFVLATPTGSATPPILPSDDFAVLRLRRWNEPFECDEPVHPLRGALLVPMTARTQLVGFIVCGPKLDRTHYLPDEVETLSTVAHRAGSSYGWLTLRPAEAAALPHSPNEYSLPSPEPT